MQIGEAVGTALIGPIMESCPFKDGGAPNVKRQSENVSKDDRPQASSGGTLGRNLVTASPGKASTVNAFFPAPEISAEQRVDSRTPPFAKVTVRGRAYSYKVAAHHLIPGDASLSPSDLYNDYMVAGATFRTVSGKKFKTRVNIGYNVNGNHNGLWLPGNYAIRGSRGPGGKTWSEITDNDWCVEYMHACVRQAGGQFHDAHTKYSEAVLKALNTMRVSLAAHQDVCTQCEKNRKVDPPFRIKTRLYLFSRYLRTKLKNAPKADTPWCSSDRFRDDMMKGRK